MKKIKYIDLNFLLQPYVVAKVYIYIYMFIYFSTKNSLTTMLIYYII